VPNFEFARIWDGVPDNGNVSNRIWDVSGPENDNVLDLWAAKHRLPLYEAALHLAETFHLRRNREEEPVNGTR